ncbi:MAG: hypothetical protein EON52_09460 [Actinomycetales bacterium]|nr:MAG: hypothetical protein EON52_09460 [Actinomycetales bacterium]
MELLMKSPRILLVTALAVAGLSTTLLVAPAAQAAGSTHLTLTYTKAMKNELNNARGTLTTPVERTVKLQYRSGTTWKTLKSTTSASDGTFQFAFRLQGTKALRFHAPKYPSHAAITGIVRTVTIVTQTGKLLVTPDSQCTFFATDRTAVASFTPARPGRKVTFQTNAGSIVGYQDGRGNVAVTIPAGSSVFSYKAYAIAAERNGAAAKTSNGYTYATTSCTFTPL